MVVCRGIVDACLGWGSICDTDPCIGRDSGESPEWDGFATDAVCTSATDRHGRSSIGRDLSVSELA